MDYKEKLEQFNATPKYKEELKLLLHLVDRFCQHSDSVLDFGCGLGTASKFIQDNCRKDIWVDGYDKTPYNEEFDYEETLLGYKCNAIYFMHSFAHIQFDDLDFLKNLLFDGKGIVIIITPNKDWIDSMKNENYVPDPTVVRHYGATELQDLFIANGFEIKMQGQFGESKNGFNERLFLVAEL